MTSFEDGGFESGLLTSWEYGSDGEGSVLLSADLKHSGSYSCKLDTGPLSYDEFGFAYIVAYSPSASETYEISFWVYIEPGGMCYWELGDDSDTITTGTGSWQKIVIDTTDNWSNGTLFVSTNLYNEGESPIQSVIYVDDFEYVGGKELTYNPNQFKTSCTGTSAQSITNPGFETGDGTGWDVDAIGSGSITSEAKRSGSYGCKLSARCPQTKWYADGSTIIRSLDLDVDTFCGMKFYYKVPYYSDSGPGTVFFRIRINYVGGIE